MRKKNRAIGLAASSVAVLGLGVLGATSAGAATSDQDAKPAGSAKVTKPAETKEMPAGVPFKPGKPAKSGDSVKSGETKKKPAGVSIKRSGHGLEIKALSKDDVDDDGVDVAKPVKPTKPAKPSGSAKPAEPSESAKPAEPNESAKPTKPAKPAKPSGSAKPAK